MLDHAADISDHPIYKCPPWVHSGEGSHAWGINGPAETGAAANRFGTVQFKTSCNPAVASDFNGAVALLHSFEYDEARAAFIDGGAQGS